MVQQLMTTFIAIFVAELGDKTQIATFSFAANPAYNRWLVLLGACTALFFVSLLAVILGAKTGDLIHPRHVKNLSGVIFIGIGLYTLWK